MLRWVPVVMLHVTALLETVTSAMSQRNECCCFSVVVTDGNDLDQSMSHPVQAQPLAHECARGTSNLRQLQKPRQQQLMWFAVPVVRTTAFLGTDCVAPPFVKMASNRTPPCDSWSDLEQSARHPVPAESLTLERARNL